VPLWIFFDGKVLVSRWVTTYLLGRGTYLLGRGAYNLTGFIDLNGATDAVCYVGTGTAREDVVVNLVGDGAFTLFNDASLGLKGLVVDGSSSSGNSNAFDVLDSGWLSAIDVTLQNINAFAPVLIDSAKVTFSNTWFKALTGGFSVLQCQFGGVLTLREVRDWRAASQHVTMQPLTQNMHQCGCCVVRASAGV
jgi:hypothetical protein